VRQLKPRKVDLFVTMKKIEEELEHTTLENFAKPEPEIKEKPRVIEHRIINSEKEFDELKTDWNLLCERTNSTVFQIYEWNRTWWDHFGAYGELQILVLYDDESLVGIAPLFIDRTEIAGIEPYTCLRMIGSEISNTKEGALLGFKPYSDYLQFLIDKNYLKTFYEHLSYFLMNEIYFDELIIDEIPENSSTLIILDNVFSSSRYEITISMASKGYNVLSEDSWDDYLKNLTSKERNNVRRSLKSIGNGEKNLFRIEEFEFNGDIKKPLNRFIKLHQNQWNARGQPGSFAEISMQKFFLDVSQKLYENGLLKIKMIQPAGSYGFEHCLGIDINLVYKNRMYGQHRALDIQSPHFTKSPGKVLLIDTIKDAVQSQKPFDFLRGDEKYKQRLATSMNQNKKIQIRVSSGYRKWVGWVLSVYHRICKTLKVESVRLQVIEDQNKSGLAVTRYFRYLFERINR